MDLSTLLLLVAWPVAIATKSSHGHRVIVKTDKGLVQGRSHYVHGKKVDVFYGIPYARPPLGELRFLHPEQLDPWDGVLDATTKPNCCMQVPDYTFGNFSGSTVWNSNTPASEDCLYLNVWAPRVRAPYANKAVLVWIYGGSFMTGSSVLDVYDASHLAAEHDVVVVSMQFRFGALGYFVLGSPESPGNAGMMDLRMSLGWVQRNIHQFGGSAHNITLMGESSGAVSIGLLMLSSLGRGLFHRAIMQSGSPQAYWGSFSLEEGRRRSLHLAQMLGCNPKAPNWQILECLRQVPAHKFPEEEYHTVKGVAQFPFLPVIDGTFLTKTPHEYLEEGLFKKIPILLGSNANEGSWLLVYAQPQHFKINTSSHVAPDNYTSAMDHLFTYFPQYPTQLNTLATDAIKFQYRDWLRPSDQAGLRTSVEKAVGDLHFTCGVADMAKTAAHYGQDVYLYRFSHRMSVSPWPEWMGVLHGDEIFFVFGRPLVKSLGYSDSERRLARKVMTWWTNFAKTGDPNRGPGQTTVKEEWPKFEMTNQRYLEIREPTATSDSTVAGGLKPQQCAFWDNYVPRLAQTDQGLYNVNCSLVSASTSGDAICVTSSRTFLLLTVVTWLIWRSQREQ